METKKSSLFAALSLCLLSMAARADYNMMNWGMDRSTSPYKIGVNLVGTWYQFATITSAGVPSLLGPSSTARGGVYSSTCSSSQVFYTLATDGNFACKQIAVSDLSGLGTGVATALGNNLNSAGGVQGTDRVATNSALASSATASFPSGVWRDHNSIATNDPPLWFDPQAGTCESNGLANDGGGCTNTTTGDGNSWLARHSADMLDARHWGLTSAASAGAATDQSAALTAALTFAALTTSTTNGALVVVLPSGFVGLSSTPDIPNNVWLDGQGAASFGVCGTTLQWVGAADGTIISSSVTSGVRVHPGMHHLCIDGGANGKIGFSKRGVQNGDFADINISINRTNGRGVFEDVPATPTYADQNSRFVDITIQAAGTGAACWEIGDSSEDFDIAHQIVRNYNCQHTYPAVGTICGNSDGIIWDHFYDQPIGGTTTSFEAKAGWVSVPNSCREHIFIEPAMHGGYVGRANGVYSSFGSRALNYKLGDGEPEPVIESGASFYWSDTFGVNHGGSQVLTEHSTIMGRETVGGTHTGQAQFEINNLVNFSVAAKFGPSLPLYIMAAGPALGFNARWNGSAIVYGAGSSSKYAGQLGFDTSTGDFVLYSSGAPGNADSSATMASVLSVSQAGVTSSTKLNATTGFQANGTDGYSGTKTAGSCTFTISGGIITNVAGC